MLIRGVTKQCKGSLNYDPKSFKFKSPLVCAGLPPHTPFQAFLLSETEGMMLPGICSQHAVQLGPDTYVDNHQKVSANVPLLLLQQEE